jgi:hypothetical protein
MMKLEKIIHRALFEQRSGKIKKVPVNKPEDVPIPEEVPDIIPNVRRNILKPMNRKGLDVAQQHGAVNNIWSAFSVIRLASKPGKEKLLQVSSVSSAVAAITKLTKEKGSIDYGAGGPFDKKGETGIAKYMYIVGPNVSKFKRVFKYNVWICNYEQLFMLSKKLDQTEPLQSYDVVNIEKRQTIGQIPVFLYTEAAKWFQSLQQKINDLKANTKQYAALKPDLKPKNSNVLIPELQYLNVDYDPSAYENMKSTVEITDANAEDYTVYNYKNNSWYETPFRGFAKLDLNSAGEQILIPLKGTHPVVRTGDRVRGMFTGEFVNGAPDTGIAKYDDGTISTISSGDARVTIDPSGQHSFTFKPSGTSSTEAQLRVSWRDTPDVIKLLQQDIQSMIDNNPEWVNSLVNSDASKFGASLKSFTPNGKWDDNMIDVAFIINVQFLGDTAWNSETKTWHRGIESEIPEIVRKNIIKYKSEKIPL